MNLTDIISFITALAALSTIAANMKTLFSLRFFPALTISFLALIVFFKPATFLMVNISVLLQFLFAAALIGIMILLIRLRGFLEDKENFDSDNYFVTMFALFVPVMVLVFNLLSKRIVDFSGYYAGLSATNFSVERLQFVFQNGRESVFCVLAITSFVCCLLNTGDSIIKSMYSDYDKSSSNRPRQQSYSVRITLCFLPLVFCTNFIVVLFDKCVSIIV